MTYRHSYPVAVSFFLVVYIHFSPAFSVFSGSLGMYFFAVSNAKFCLYVYRRVIHTIVREILPLCAKHSHRLNADWQVLTPLTIDRNPLPKVLRLTTRSLTTVRPSKTSWQALG